MELERSCILDAEAAISQEAQSISSSVRLRGRFRQITKSFKQLESVNFENVRVVFSGNRPYSQDFCGIGGIRYIPSYLADSNNTNPEIFDEVQNLNSSIALKLAHLGKSYDWDRLFLAGRDISDPCDEIQTVCIVIGLDVTPFTEDTIRETLSLIMAIGSELEMENHFEDRISSLVKEGIMQAEKELANSEKTLLGSLVGYGLSIFGLTVPEEKQLLNQKSFDLSTGFNVRPILKKDSALEI